MNKLASMTIASSLIGLLALSVFAVAAMSGTISNPVLKAFAQEQSSGRDNSMMQSGNASNTGSTQQQQGVGAQAKTMYKAEYPKITADSRTSLVLQTDKRLYKPGEQVTIQGSIWSNVLAQLGEDANSITIQVTDNRGNVVADEELEIDSDGQYSTMFTLPENAELGAYTINTNIDVDANVLATLEAGLSAKLKASSRFAVVSSVAFAVNAEGKQFDVNVASNSSTVKDFAFSQAAKKVSFTVEGETGTKGVAQITLPKELLSGQLIVSIDGRAVAEDSNDVIVTSDTSSEMTLEINYPHSEHTIEVTGTNVVPEFSISMLIMAVALGSIVAMVTIKSRSTWFNSKAI